MENPLVSVICLCYNQANFVWQAMESVVNQTYDNIELILVDDGSVDGSKHVIREWLKKRSCTSFVDLDDNIGSTSAFNRGLAVATGKYVIDLAGDDVLLNERIKNQVFFFESQQENVGVIYSDAQYVNEQGEELHRHFSNPNLSPLAGNIYERVIDTYFIPTPTMMMKKSVLDELEGYDEKLAYEDFDFWVRSARNWNYAYQHKVLTQVRLVKGSYSTTYYEGSDQLASTVHVCLKIAELNKTRQENDALINRLKYEIRHAFLQGRKEELTDFFRIWARLGQIPTLYLIIKCIGKLGISLKRFKKPFKSLYKAT